MAKMRDGVQDPAGQEGLPDTRRPLDDDADPDGRMLPGHCEHQIVRGPLYGVTIGRT
jgi:hypothetical protein